MDTEQARAILRANEVKSRALLNLENAARMSTDDPRSKELLEEAGDAYAGATLALRRVDNEAIEPIREPAEPTVVDAGPAVAVADTVAETDCRLCGTAKGDAHKKCPSCGKLDRPPAIPAA